LSRGLKDILGTTDIQENSTSKKAPPPNPQSHARKKKLLDEIEKKETGRNGTQKSLVKYRRHLAPTLVALGERPKIIQRKAPTKFLRVRGGGGGGAGGGGGEGWGGGGGVGGRQELIAPKHERKNKQV